MALGSFFCMTTKMISMRPSIYETIGRIMLSMSRVVYIGFPKMDAKRSKRIG